MLSRNKIKYLQQLQQKKYRNKYNCFVVEGEKLLKEALSQQKFEIEEIFVTYDDTKSGIDFPSDTPVQQITANELGRISSLKTPHKALAVLKQPRDTTFDHAAFEDAVLYLDRIQDPGNLGTIIRTADWFGIKNIICSTDSAEVYNPKVVQATMGSIFRVAVWYTNFTEKVLPHVKSLGLPVYGTFLDGDNVYGTKLKKPCIVVLGNESKGISQDIEKHINQKIHIPSFPGSSSNSESLNVAVTAGIICSELRRGD